MPSLGAQKIVQWVRHLVLDPQHCIWSQEHHQEWMNPKHRARSAPQARLGVVQNNQCVQSVLSTMTALRQIAGIKSNFPFDTTLLNFKKKDRHDFSSPQSNSTDIKARLNTAGRIGSDDNYILSLTECWLQSLRDSSFVRDHTLTHTS